jgi:hypothetical protein
MTIVHIDFVIKKYEQTKLSYIGIFLPCLSSVKIWRELLTYFLTRFKDIRNVITLISLLLLFCFFHILRIGQASGVDSAPLIVRDKQVYSF